MVVQMFNFWYFFWLALASGSTVGLYFGLRNKKRWVQRIVLFSFLVLGLLLHFLKLFVPPYSENMDRLLRDSWFVNICGANIALFPFLFWSKRKAVKDFMFYLGLLGGMIAIVYPQEVLGVDGYGIYSLDIIRFYFHHWMLMAVPLLMVLLKLHTLSWRRVLWVPVGLLLLMLFIILNQFFQAELGFIPIRGSIGFYHVLHFDYWMAFNDVNWKNNSYIYGPNIPDPIGKVFAIFCPKFFTKVPVGPYAGQPKYWPWFWIICPAFILLTPIVFGICMIFDHKNFVKDVKAFTWKKFLSALCSPFRKMKALVMQDDNVVEVEENSETTTKETIAVESTAMDEVAEIEDEANK